jgi:hypothetical protein
VDDADLATGDAAAGRRYFNGAGGCSACHSTKGDLAGIASRYQGLALLMRMLYPSGRPAPTRPKVTVRLPSGQTIVQVCAYLCPGVGEDCSRCDKWSSFAGSFVHSAGMSPRKVSNALR